MADHPYRSLPETAFWSRSVARDFDAGRVWIGERPLLVAEDRVVSAGSCFASNMVPWLESWGLSYVRTEVMHPAFAGLGENLGYANFSAAYGNVYTARQLVQLIQRATGEFEPVDSAWVGEGEVVDPFRPGLRFPATCLEEFQLLQAQHLKAVVEALVQCTVFVFTLGLTEAWVSSVDGAAYPTCPGTVAGSFDPTKHRHHNYTVAEVVDDLHCFATRLGSLNREARIILTVSPVPLVATATGDHVLAATSYSKSVLRVAAQEVVNSLPNAYYFPSYEIVCGPQAPWEYYEPDRRSVSALGVAAVMAALRAASDLPDLGDSPEPKTDGVHTGARDTATLSRAELSRAVAEAECDELMADRPD